MKNLTTKNLQKLAKDSLSDSLEKYCIDYLLDNFYTPEERVVFLKDLFNHGCISGMVSGLIYYSDTVAFFNQYEGDIEDLITEYADSQVISFTECLSTIIQTTTVGFEGLKNNCAWFGFEQTMKNIASNFGVMEEYI